MTFKLGFVTGCFATNMVQQSSKGWIEVSSKYVAAYAGPMKLHVINFTEIQLYIYEKCPHDELTIMSGNNFRINIDLFPDFHIQLNLRLVDIHLHIGKRI